MQSSRSLLRTSTPPKSRHHFSSDNWNQFVNRLWKPNKNRLEEKLECIFDFVHLSGRPTAEQVYLSWGPFYNYRKNCTWVGCERQKILLKTRSISSDVSYSANQQCEEIGSQVSFSTEWKITLSVIVCRISFKSFELGLGQKWRIENNSQETQENEIISFFSISWKFIDRPLKAELNHFILEWNSMNK